MVRELSLSQAIDGFLRYKLAAGMSPHTISDYRVSFRKLQAFLPDDPAMGSLGREQLVGFFAWLQDGYVSDPDGIAPRGKRSLSTKSVFNIHTNLFSLWSWAKTEGFATSNVVRAIVPPRFSSPVVEPFSKEEIASLLKACDVSRTWKTRADVASRRPSADRDRAIVMVLLDTGIRASELCNIRFSDLNLGTNSAKVKGKGPGREGKERTVFFGKRTSQSVWRYLAPRLQAIRPDDLVFLAGKRNTEGPMSRHLLGKLLARIGDRAGVRGVHPHRFGHTFAITYIRNQGDIFTLQALLGHSDLTMVRRYARVAQMDCAEAHRRASPVDNWRL